MAAGTLHHCSFNDLSVCSPLVLSSPPEAIGYERITLFGKNMAIHAVPPLSSGDHATIGRLVPPLRAILDEELRRGNVVVETWEGWPNNASLFVMLGAPFAKQYEAEGIRFVSVEDPHYWKEEYQHVGSSHALGCRFA